jgi:hypothetical protein
MNEQIKKEAIRNIRNAKNSIILSVKKGGTFEYVQLSDDGKGISLDYSMMMLLGAIQVITGEFPDMKVEFLEAMIEVLEEEKRK